MGWNQYISAVLLMIHLTLSLASADSIHGCGGFVEASAALIRSRKPTDPKLDYSDVAVELQTLDGLVKDTTQCAPNGYYFIPVYDKGSFLIKVKGPDGWSWDPEQVAVVVDDSGCNANKDIDFHLTGFTVSGKVAGAVGGESCLDKNGGPSNVIVELISPGGDVVSSVLTTSNGDYSFRNIVPGNYKLRASRHDLDIEVRGSAEVELGLGNNVADDFFFAPGYDIRGFVVAQGNPILGVNIYLYSDNDVEVSCPPVLGTAPGDSGKALCHVVTDSEGRFTFKSIPCGTYKLVPFYKGENTVFDVSPASISLSVGHDHALVHEKFQVTGFSLGGRVVNEDGIGIDGVKIVVDGEERATTDGDGYYKLDQVTSKQYTIGAKKDHYVFNTLQDFLVLPNMASIADIKPKLYDVCGVVRTVGFRYETKVALTDGTSKFKPQVKQSDEKGNFCFKVPPGEYRLSAIAVATAPESDPELLLSPRYVDVKVRKPLFNIEFYQAQVNVQGSVKCKEKCGPTISVSLERLDGKHKENIRTISLTDQSNDFSFPNTLPGKYRMKIKNKSPAAQSEEDIWCWEERYIDVDVGTEDVEGVVFVQKGYLFKFTSSHDVDVLLKQPDGPNVNLKIKRGSQQLCLESRGVHNLSFVNSCIFFGSSSFSIDTSNPSPVFLKGEKYLLQGEIHLESNSFDSAEKLPDNMSLEVLTNDGTLIDRTIGKLVAKENDLSSTAVYDYSIWALPGESFIFGPSDSRVNAEKKILFYPRQQHISVSEISCPVTVAPFSGRLGMYIEGSVSPPISDVSVRIIAAGNSQSASLKQGDIALETNTGGDGLFSAGPLYDDISYKVEASKPGYHVKKIGPHSFSCQKLGQISVKIYSKQDMIQPFPPVLLSLSGEDGYRNNSVTETGGTIVFGNLFPGSFYLRALLKEYAFSPPGQAIELGSGEARDVIFHATRVAYSAIGVVNLLSGQPKEGVSIEARAKSKGFYEETLTDPWGRYRLRGLHPNTTYEIKVAKKGKYDSNQIERASPEVLTIEVGSEDIKGLDFVVFERPEVTIVSGHVEGKRIKELHSHLQVEVKSATEPWKTESVFPLPLSNFFQLKGLPKGRHLLQLRYALPSSTHRFQSEVIEVDLESHAHIHVGPLRYRLEEDHQKQELTTAPVYPLIIGISVITLFISLPRLNGLYQATIGASMSGSLASGKREVKKPLLRK